MAIWNILRPFGTFYSHFGNLVVTWYIFPLWYIVSRKIWQPWSQAAKQNAQKIVIWETDASTSSYDTIDIC
jgi:hypothetical protein